MKPSTIAKPGGRRKLKEKEEFLVNMVNQAKVIKANMSPFLFHNLERKEISRTWVGRDCLEEERA